MDTTPAFRSSSNKSKTIDRKSLKDCGAIRLRVVPYRPLGSLLGLFLQHSGRLESLRELEEELQEWAEYLEATLKQG